MTVIETGRGERDRIKTSIDAGQSKQPPAVMNAALVLLATPVVAACWSALKPKTESEARANGSFAHRFVCLEDDRAVRKIKQEEAAHLSSTQETVRARASNRAMPHAHRTDDSTGFPSRQVT